MPVPGSETGLSCVKPEPLKAMIELGRALVGRTETPSAVALPVAVATFGGALGFAGSGCCVSVIVNERLPLGTNGAGTLNSLATPTEPVGSVSTPVAPSTGTPSIARSTFELGAKPV